MENVFPLEGMGLPTGHLPKGVGQPGPPKMGAVERVLDKGLFLVVLDGGGKLEVKGRGSLKPGDRVQVLFTEGVKFGKRGSDQEPLGASQASLSHWTAWMPLAFGGKDALAKLEVFLEKQPGKKAEKDGPAAYFVFTVKTLKHGEVQWSVHLKGRQLSLQVYAPGTSKEGLMDLIRGIEKALADKGFALFGKTVLLERPFRAPGGGIRLNVTG